MNKMPLILAILFSGCFGGRTKNVTGLEGKPLPQFSMLLTDSISKINTANISTGHPFVLFYFSPYCPYCKAQTKELQKEMKSFGDTHFYFVSGFSIDKIKTYEELFGLSKLKNITMAQVDNSSFSNYYQASVVPCTIVYDKNKKLKEVMYGSVSASDIRSAVFEN